MVSGDRVAEFTLASYLCMWVLDGRGIETYCMRVIQGETITLRKALYENC